MKKFAAAAIAAAITATSVIPAYAINPKAIPDEVLMPVLAEMEIMQGDADGNMRLNDYVSRAEFSKIAVASSPYRNMVSSSIAISPFKDVPHTFWGAPYIQVATQGGMFKGYPDGTFKPENTVTYEEAITVFLNLLGYTDADFGISWPYGQVGIAEKIGLCDNLDLEIGSLVTRRDAAILCYNLLNTQPKGYNVDYITATDYAIVEDVTLIASHNEDSGIALGKVYTTSGMYDVPENFNYMAIGMKGDIVTKNGDELIGFIPSEDNTLGYEQYVIYSQLEDAIIGYKDGAFTQVDINNSTTAYKDKVQTTYAAIKGGLEMGDVLYVKMDGNVIDYITYEKGNIDGPYTASNENYLSHFAVNSDTDFVRNGNGSSSAEIQNGDILYYSKDLNMIFAYNNRITGIYEKAEPNKDTPTSVVISGKTYKIEGVSAFNKLSSKGSLSYGDTITVQLGKNNQIADVVTADVSVDTVYGYVTETGIKEFTASDTTTSVKNYAKVVGTDGAVHEYSTKENYDNLVNQLVRIDFDGGIAKLSYAKNSISVSGKVDWNGRRIGSAKLSDDVEIIDVLITGEENAGAYSKVYPQRIDGNTLSSKNVLFAEKNENGEIEKLVLNDFTGDVYTYGMVKKANSVSAGMFVSGAYTFVINGREVPAATSQKAFSVGGGQPAKFTMFANGTVDTVQGLKRMDGAVTEVTDTYITVGGVKHKLADDVIVYEKDYNYDYTIKNVSDIKNNLAMYNVLAYQDKTHENGGRVRVIVIQAK